MTATEAYQKWFTSLPDWTKTALSLDGQKKDNYLHHLSRSGQLSGAAQIELRDAEIQRIRFWENPEVRRHALRQIKQRKIVVPQNVPKVEQIFEGPLSESFKLLEWGWYGRDPSDALSIAEVAARVGCKPRQLKKRLKHYGYTKDRLFLDGYWHLEQLETEEKRQANQKRQAIHRVNESPEAKAKRQFADREHKRQLRAARKIQKVPKKVVLGSQKKIVADIQEREKSR